MAALYYLLTLCKRGASGWLCCSCGVCVVRQGYVLALELFPPTPKAAERIHAVFFSPAELLTGVPALHYINVECKPDRRPSALRGTWRNFHGLLFSQKTFGVINYKLRVFYIFYINMFSMIFNPLLPRIWATETLLTCEKNVI